MIIQPFSDIHNYDLYFRPKKTNADILICAGDMDQGTDSVIWANTIHVEHNKKIFSGLGNHDFWTTTKDNLDFDEWSDFYKKNSNENVKFLNNETVVVEDVAFIFSTLWSDFDNNNNLTINLAQNASKDFKKIRMPDDRHINAFDMMMKFETSKQFIISQLEKYQDKKCVVVTHFPPSISCNTTFDINALSYYWCGQMENVISMYQPVLWISGHMHNFYDKMFGNTRMIINPAGKIINNIAQNKQFRFDLTIEV